MGNQKDYEIGIKRVTAEAVYTWGYLAGFNSASSLAGDSSDWLFAKGASESGLATGVPITTPTAAVNNLSYTAFATNPVWVYIPLGEAGYRSFVVNLTCGDMDNLCKATAYAVAENIPVSGIQTPFEKMVNAFYIIKDETIPSTVGSQLVFGPGGVDTTLYPAAPMGGMILKLEKVSTAPTLGQLRLFIARSK